MDDDVQKKSGIYPYVLRGEEKFLNIRAFSNSMRESAYEKQAGVCVLCQKQFSLKEMEADHITPWSEGGKTVPENCQMLCRECNRRKSNR
jgi:5-methylcytosine-specific restriction endonuclease McrA